MLQWSDKLHVLFKLTRKTQEQCHTTQPCLKFDLKCTFPECTLVGVYWPCSSWSMMRNSTSTLVKMTTRNNSEINICLTTPSMNGYNEKMYNALRAGCPTSSLTRWRSFIMRSPAGVNPKMKAYFAKKSHSLLDKNQTCWQNWSDAKNQENSKSLFDEAVQFEISQIMFLTFTKSIVLWFGQN